MNSNVPPVIPQEKLAIKYSLTRWDLFRLHLRVQFQNRWILALLTLPILLIVWSTLSTPEMQEKPIGLRIFTGVFIIVTFVAMMSILLLLLAAGTVAFKQFRGVLGEHELEVRDEGLMERTTVNESLHRWAGFLKVVSTGTYLYIYVTDNQIHMVPKHFFGSDEAATHFAQVIRGRMDAARRVA